MCVFLFSVLFDVLLLDKNALISFTRLVYLVEYLLSYGIFLLFCYSFELCRFSLAPSLPLTFSFYRSVHWYSLPVDGDGSDRSTDDFHRAIYVTKLICFSSAFFVKWNWLIIGFQPRCSDVLFRPIPIVNEQHTPHNKQAQSVDIWLFWKSVKKKHEKKKFWKTKDTVEILKQFMW